jgi:hypothetical protein
VWCFCQVGSLDWQKAQAIFTLRVWKSFRQFLYDNVLYSIYNWGVSLSFVFSILCLYELTFSTVCQLPWMKAYVSLELPSGKHHFWPFKKIKEWWGLTYFLWIILLLLYPYEIYCPVLIIIIILTIVSTIVAIWPQSILVSCVQQLRN